MIDRKQVLWGITDREDRLFLSKMCDLAQKSTRISKVMYTRFLNPREQMLALQRLGGSVEIRFHGGFDGADRAVAAFVPNEWEEPMYPVAGVEITPTNKRVYSHRDYLGALLALGIKRELIGDIIITETGAVVAVMEEILDFIMMNLSSVASANVRLSVSENLASYGGQVRFKEISATVSSLRLDCVLSSFAAKSRCNSASAISEGLVSVNYEVVKSSSYQIKDGDVISLKGFGKVIAQTDGNLTKKGRIHITFKKYV